MQVRITDVYSDDGYYGMPGIVGVEGEFTQVSALVEPPEGYVGGHFYLNSSCEHFYFYAIKVEQIA